MARNVEIKARVSDLVEVEVQARRIATAGPKVSDYCISRTDSPAAMRETLARALGVVGRVRKLRRLYLVDRTRIYLDNVEGLGSLVELEVVLAEGESPGQGAEIAQRIMNSLGIGGSQLVQGAYVDLQK